MSLSLAEFQEGLEFVTTDYGRQLLLTHATNAGDPFIRLYYKQFPVAIPANEQHTNTDNMNINTTVKIEFSFDAKAEAVLNKIAEAMAINGQACLATASTVSELPDAAQVAQATPAGETPAPEAPKRRVPKATPTPKTPVEAVEPDLLKDVPTGAELKDRIIPLKGTGYPQKLRDYMDGPLGLKGVLLVAVTDVDALKKIDDKITELLKEAAAESDDV